MKDILLASFSILASFILVILFVVFGWYAVWKLILCRFRFITELLKEAGDSTITELKTTHNKTKKLRRD